MKGSISIPRPGDPDQHTRDGTGSLCHTYDPDYTIKGCTECESLVAARNKEHEEKTAARERRRIERLLDEAHRFSEAAFQSSTSSTPLDPSIVAAVIVADAIRDVGVHLEQIAAELGDQRR